MGKALGINSKGSLLFETLVALLVLGVGISGILRSFSQSLYVSERSLQQAQAKAYLEDFLFAAFSGFSEDDLKARTSAQIVAQGSRPLDLKLHYEKLELKGSAFLTGAPGDNKNGFMKIQMDVAREDGRRIFDTETVVMSHQGGLT